MISIFNQYIDFLNKLASIEEYIKKTYQRNNGINSIIKNYNGDSYELLHYYKSIIGSQLQYNAIVINLYGSYENFVTKICEAYLVALFSASKSTESLPNGLIEKYKSSVGDYLNNKQKLSNLDLSLDEVIENYNSFLKSDFSNLNYELLLHHSANLNSTQLQAFLKEIGIVKDGGISNSDFLKKFYIENKLCDEMEFRQKLGHNKDLFIYLDTLVNSRNLIAHTGEDQNRISANDFIELIIPFLKTIARILLDYITIALYKNYSNNATISIIKIFNNKILCINNQGNNIQTGDIVVYRYNNNIHSAIINHIEINHRKVEETGTNCIDVGLELDNKIKESSQIVCIINCNRINIKDD